MGLGGKKEFLRRGKGNSCHGRPFNCKRHDFLVNQNLIYLSFSGPCHAQPPRHFRDIRIQGRAEGERMPMGGVGEHQRFRVQADTRKGRSERRVLTPPSVELVAQQRMPQRRGVDADLVAASGAGMRARVAHLGAKRGG